MRAAAPATPTGEMLGADLVPGFAREVSNWVQKPKKTGNFLWKPLKFR
jgi:hypothetical protein